jgi:glycosyltransferase involved in cell wall biosynthesis
MERTSLEYADGLLASSRHTAEYCARAYGVDTSKAGVVYSGTDITRFSPRPPVTGDDRSPRILFVGNLSGGKGLTDLIRVAARLRGRFPRLILRAIGNGTKEQLTAVDRLIKSNDLASNVEIVGFVPYEKLPDQYAWCEFFAAPSVYEGGPGNVYLEAMACGRPVIACGTGGIPEVVTDGTTGLLVRPHDLAQIEQAIITLAENAALRDRLGQAGRERVVSDFSVERYLDKCEAHYRELSA